MTAGCGRQANPPFDLIRSHVILETQAEQMLACLKAETVSTNVHLRKLHNFCLAMNWLPWPIIPSASGGGEVPAQTAITFAEHQKIIERERIPSARISTNSAGISAVRRPTSPTLNAGDIDWSNRTIAYTGKRPAVWR